ncbi:hypothetical protein [Massilia sp. NP310]|jgi:hypothetical protein|uniref:hypothetical protein n=1 Tax=Massilia sp. NP310 TaxID=2861282 RepID=UPI001C625624|nr:hypothetical protein [Massilia sp. NP310]QYG02784.1 hypothetical protein KY496_05050 [Massilia sp. NP310]
MPNHHEKLDRLKLLSAMAILKEHDLPTIRKTSLANLDRWVAKGTWVSAFDEWRKLMSTGSDAEVISRMTGLDEDSNRLRQSPPYAGLIKPETRKALLKSVGLKPPSTKAVAAAERFLAEEESKPYGE